MQKHDEMDPPEDQELDPANEDPQDIHHRYAHLKKMRQKLMNERLSHELVVKELQTEPQRQVPGQNEEPKHNNASQQQLLLQIRSLEHQLAEKEQIIQQMNRIFDSRMDSVKQEIKRKSVEKNAEIEDVRIRLSDEAQTERTKREELEKAKQKDDTDDDSDSVHVKCCVCFGLPCC